jgi:hypothetical protein
MLPYSPPVLRVNSIPVDVDGEWLLPGSKVVVLRHPAIGGKLVGRYGVVVGFEGLKSRVRVEGSRDPICLEGSILRVVVGG